MKTTSSISSIIRAKFLALARRIRPFPGSEEYWKQRYKAGGTSGDGSYNRLAEFKAEVLNSFVSNNKIQTVIEYGCGDGNQLKLATYPSYIGFDISAEAISQCEVLFSDDATKTFNLNQDYAGQSAQLTLSLDVIYHLIEDDVFSAYMKRLFDSSSEFVIIYSSDTDKQNSKQAPHVKHRMFSKWVEENRLEWQLCRYIPNKYPITSDGQSGSFSDFYIYKKPQ